MTHALTRHLPLTRLSSARGSSGCADMLLPTRLVCTLAALECADECRNDADLRQRERGMRSARQINIASPPQLL